MPLDLPPPSSKPQGKHLWRPQQAKNLHKEGSSNLSQVIQHELHSKANSDQLLNCGPPLLNPFSKHSIYEFMLNVVHHAPQQLKEMLPYGLAKEKPLHEIPTAVKDYLQVGDALPKNPKTMEVNIRSSSTLEACRIKIIGLGLVKLDEEGSSLTCQMKNDGRTVANLKPRRWSHLNRSWTWKEV